MDIPRLPSSDLFRLTSLHKSASMIIVPKLSQKHGFHRVAVLILLGSESFSVLT
jgi:hypothetical protein